ncbi:MAG: gliding motility lipoprotein GldH [Cyclobacteriaceae bacterium]
MCKYALLSLFFLIFVTGCDNQRLFEEKADFENMTWPIGAPATFEFDISDTDLSYNLYVSIRNSIDYPFHNLYLMHQLQDPEGAVISKSLNNIILFDPKTGRPEGKGVGTTRDLQKLLMSDQKFEKSGKYKIRLDQYMRPDVLLGVASVGIRVEKVDG